MDCRSLFPFEKVPLGAKVLIYGCTSLGLDYWQQLTATHYAECLGFLDRKAEQYAGLPVQVYLPEQAGEIKMEYIVILNYSYLTTIKQKRPNFCRCNKFVSLHIGKPSC